MLRALGYPRLVSVENFRTPNFPLVAEVLAWVVKRFDPKAEDLPSIVETEHDRVLFIRMVAQFMATKAHVRLNTKKLYQADGFAVQEILKALTLLYSALQNNDPDNDLEDEGGTTHNFDMSNRTGELKQIRALASNITTKGAALFDLLRREVNLREMRTNVMNRPLEVIDVERGLQEAVAACEAELRETQKAIENVATDEATVEAKCEKKKTALERNQKRLLAIKKSRPAFMDEYEKLEEQLKIHYNTFVQRFMSLSYLELRLEENEKNELSQMSQREALH
ncbi:hypothetical protein HAZT_HAZT007472 [Hyalella azteca]|uniref:Clusterin-associated protein 1 n=1 Tax=Hyalella azteca TaxID=294128 RepID=A0A6A0GT75_HYAAZ|nr:hypothetical protein HAZT_HAZT007472 [Hyalella azteca]